MLTVETPLLRVRAAAAAAACLVMLAVAPAHSASYDVGATVQAAPDRSDEDRKMDARRQPAKLLNFAGIKPGMTVADLMAGGGYTTELLARAVGKDGKVYAQNSPTASEKSLTAMAERLKKPVMANVVSISTPTDEPFSDKIQNLDVVTFVLNYHDTTFLPIDRARMNKAVFAALKPGGVYLIVDHAAKAGDGATVGKTLHRIEESTVVSEVEAAGFKKEAEGGFLRQPSDAKDQPFFKMGDQPTDQFVLKFRKP
jgi:predicted methyltransferase